MWRDLEGVFGSLLSMIVVSCLPQFRSDLSPCCLRPREAEVTVPYLFLTQRGTTLSARGVQIVFRSLKKKLNLDGRKLSPHLLRHSFALAYIENGGDPFSLQRILGHTDQTTTSKYVNMARTNVKSQHSKYSPGERLD